MHSQNLITKRRSAAAIMAFAVLDLFPTTKLVYGRETEFGFYYDFVFTHPLGQQFLSILEERIRMLAVEARPLVTKNMMRENAAAYFNHHGQEYMAEVALDAVDPMLSLVQMDSFMTLCEEPHVATTKEIPYFKIHEMRSITPEVIRIEAFAFDTKDELKKFSKRYEEAKKKSYLKVGPEIGFLSFVNGGFYLLPRGVKFKNIILELMRSAYAEKGFVEVSAPVEVHAQLVTERKNFVKLVQLQGRLLDEASIFCASSQLLEEFTSSLHFILKIIKLLSIEHTLTQPFPSDPHVGTKVQVFFKDAVGRSVEGAYVEVCKSGLIDYPFVIRMSLCGELERLITLLIEHFAGKFPLRLAPEQVRILPVSARHLACAQRLKQALGDVRVSIDALDGNLGQRMHLAQIEKIPYVCIIGDEELKNEGQLTVRVMDREDSLKVTLPDFLAQLQEKM